MSALEVTRDAQTWERWLEDVEDVDPRDRPAYHDVARRLDPGEPCCARFEDAAGVLVHPFLKRPLHSVDGSSDLTSVYDFGGYAMRCAPEAAGELIDRFRSAWAEWCRDQIVVSEFVRLHPLRLPSTHLAAVEGRFRRHQEHAVIELAALPSEPAEAYAASHRRNLRRGHGAGLACDLLGAAEVGTFAKLYETTMRLRRAPAFYFFPPAFFEELLERVPQAHLFGVRLDGQPIAAALFLASGSTLFYFLGGSGREHDSVRPNNVLFDGVIRWARERGFRRLHLGGGAPSLMRFKEGFGARRVPYYLHSIIHDRERYERLVAAAPGGQRAFFPQYRAAAFFGEPPEHDRASSP